MAPTLRKRRRKEYPITLDELNEDCLYEIFQYLDITDLIAMDRMGNHKITRVVNRLSPHQIANNKLVVAMEHHPHFTELFIRCAPLLKNLFFDCGLASYCPKHSLLNVAAAHCRNVKQLTIVGGFLSGRKQFNMPMLFKNLKQLRLVDTFIYDDQFKWLMKGNTRLQRLQLQSCRKLKGRFLAKLKNLKQVWFEDIEFKPEQFIQFLKNNQTMEDLTLDDCPKANEQCWLEIANLPQLHTIYLPDEVNFNQYCLQIAQMPSLRTIITIFPFTYGKFNRFLATLAETNTLENLESIGYTSERLLPISRMTNLKRLQLELQIHDGDLSYLFRLKKLEGLCLLNSSKVTNENVLELVAKFPLLSQLDLRNAKDIKLGLEVELEKLLKSLNRKLELVVDHTDLWVLTKKPQLKTGALKLSANEPYTAAKAGSNLTTFNSIIFNSIR